MKPVVLSCALAAAVVGASPLAHANFSTDVLEDEALFAEAQAWFREADAVRRHNELMQQLRRMELQWLRQCLAACNGRSCESC